MTNTRAVLSKPQPYGRLRLKCDGTRAETRFRLSRETDESIYIGWVASVQSTTGSRGVRISGSNAAYTMFRSNLKGTGYPLHSPLFPFTSPPVRHRVPSYFQLDCTHKCAPAQSRNNAVTFHLFMDAWFLKGFMETYRRVGTVCHRFNLLAPEFYI